MGKKLSRPQLPSQLTLQENSIYLEECTPCPPHPHQGQLGAPCPPTLACGGRKPWAGCKAWGSGCGRGREFRRVGGGSTGGNAHAHARVAQPSAPRSPDLARVLLRSRHGRQRCHVLWLAEEVAPREEAEILCKCGHGEAWSSAWGSRRGRDGDAGGPRVAVRKTFYFGVSVDAWQGVTNSEHRPR
jgi:hypothetical protein